MIVSFLLILIVLGVLCLLGKRRQAGTALVLISGAAFILIGNGYLARMSLQSLQTHAYVVHPEWKNKNLIVLLGAGTVQWPQVPPTLTAHPWAYSRIYEAARLYMNCKTQSGSCTILTSGGDPNKNQISEAEAMANALIAIGVAENDLVLENLSRNTFQNAKFSTPLIRSGHYDQIYLVTSGFHLTRALLYFSFFQMLPIAAPADQMNAMISLVPTAMNLSFFDLALHEYGGILQFYVYNLFGWNSPSASGPGNH